MVKYTISEVKEKLGLTRHKFDTLVARGQLGVVVIGKRRFVTQEQLEAYCAGPHNVKKYSVKEAEGLLGVSRYAMDGIIDRGEIGTTLVGKRLFITERQLDTYMTAKEQESRSVIRERTILNRVNEELTKMEAMHMTAREEVLVDALYRAMSEQLSQIL